MLPLSSSTIPAALLAASLISLVPAFGGVVINEFMASNNSGLLDEDGSSSDWIELYNPDGATVDLGGHHLTDDAAAPTKWTIPAGVTLAPGAYLVIFASNKDRAVAGQQLHTNFNLAVGGEYLALTAPGGAPVLHSYSPTFPVQSADVSYGLLSSVVGGAEGFFYTPTPGAANAAVAQKVTFSPPSRTFNQGTTFPVTLSSLGGTATIRYTLNRAIPINEEGVAPAVTVDFGTDVWTSAVPHGLKSLDPVQLAGTMPSGAGIGITYFVKALTPTTFQLTHEPGGTTLDVGSAGGAMHLRRHAAQFTAVSGTNITVTEHRFYTGDTVRFSTTGTLPTPLNTTTTYFVQVADRNTIRLTPTYPTGTTISLSGGSGTHTIRRLVSPLYTGPITVDHSLRLRAGSFEAGRADGPLVSESYLMLDAAAQSFTSNLPVMVLHSFGSGHPSATAPAAGVPEDTKEDVWFSFEPKPEGVAPNITMVTRLTNAPDLATPGYFERRGSSTFGAAKYSMTAGAYNEYGQGKDVSPLGFASNDDFVFNAHFQFDRSLMHNDLIYRLSNEIGRWAPRTRHVEVFMSVANDVAATTTVPGYGVVTGTTTGADYYGVFSFQDKISRGNNRIDIEKIETTDNTAPNVQGGYIFKIDRRDGGDLGFAGAGRTVGSGAAGTVGFSFVQPKEFTAYPAHLPVVTAAQSAYLTNTLDAMYNALNGANFMDPALGYQAHFDVPACIDHWWLSVLPKSADAFRLSGYWHKSRFGKLAMGPIFDFDRAMGSTDGRDLNPLTWRGDVADYGTDYFHSASIFTPNYFDRMFRDPNFWQGIIDRYEELRRGKLSTANIHAIINEYTELLDPADGANTPAKRNGQKWVTSFNPYYRNAAANTPGTNGTFRGEAAWLKNWWGKAGAVTANGRMDFVDGQFVRPAVPSVPEGPVPTGTSVALSSPSGVTPGVKIYYTTDGTDPRAPATATQTLYTPGTFATLATFLPEISTVRAIVPNAASVGGPTGVEWRGADLNSNGNNADDFDDSAWFTNAAGTINGVGYDDDTATLNYLPYIGIRWSSALNPVAPNNNTNTMRNVNGSCYARYAFTLTPADMALLVAGNRLALSVRIDDTLIAWINGTQVANQDGQTASWNTVWTGNRDANLTIPTEIDLTSFMNTLHVGTNLLAIQCINGGSTASSDLIIQPKLLLQGNSVARPAYVPQLTAGATEYTAPLPINAPTKITARTLFPLLASDPPTATTPPGGNGPAPNGSSWSGPTVLYYFPGAVSASQSSIKITEVNYHPPAPTAAEITAGWTNSNDFEFIRLTNTGNVPVDLTGIYFSNGLTFTAGPGLQNWLPAGQSVVVVENTAAFVSRYGSSFTILGQFGGELDDGGEHIVLNDKTGAIISDFVYGDSAPWPESADGSRSLIYLGGDQNEASSWVASLDPGGSGVMNYAAFKQRYFAPAGTPVADQDPDDDADNDGFKNVMEYALGLDPLVADALAFHDEQNATDALVVRRRIATGTDLTYEFQSSPNLTTWTTGTAASVNSNGDGTETCVFEPVSGSGRSFLQMRVTLP